MVSCRHQAPARTIDEVPVWGQLRRHRGDVRRRTVAEPTEEVVGREPLRRRRGLRPGDDNEAAYEAALAAAIVVRL